MASDIRGPLTWPPTSEPPGFDVTPDGHPFWMVELAAEPELMTASFAADRTPDNYFLGGDADNVFATGDTWIVPQEVWDRIGLGERIFYRLFTSESDADWVQSTVSVEDPFSPDLPVVEIDSSEPTDGAIPDEGDDATSTDGDADVAALCRYMGISRADFDAASDRYCQALGTLLTFHGVVASPDEVTVSTFGDAVRQFQSDRGLDVDGLAGEDTLWELNHPWALANRLELVVVDMDDAAPAGVQHDNDTHGFLHPRVRADIADSVARMRADLNALGVPMTSSGATRDLSVKLNPGRSATSIHYSAAAIDLATISGMTLDGPLSPDQQPYTITADGGRWRVWGRSDQGDEQTLDAVEWERETTTTRIVTGRFIDVTEVAAASGFDRIGPRSAFPKDYRAAEWWHFQSSVVLIPWVSQFGGEVLRLSANKEAEFQSRPVQWDRRKLIFHRQGGWR